MPVHVFRNIRVVHYLYGDALALAHPQQRTGDLIAVADGADYNIRGQLDHHGRDSQAEIGRALGGVRFQRRHHRMLRRYRTLPQAGRFPKQGGPQLACPGRQHGGPSQPYKLPSFQLILIPTQIDSHSVTRS